MIRRLFSRLSRGLILGLVPGLLLIGASGAHPAYATNIFDIVNTGNQECLTEENAGIVIDACDDTLARQDWKTVTAGPAGSGDVLLRNDLTGHCLTVSGTSAGSKVIIATSKVSPSGCDFSGGDHRQLWVFEFGGIANVASGLFMQSSGCMSGDDLGVFINNGGCLAAGWNLQAD